MGGSEVGNHFLLKAKGSFPSRIAKDQSPQARSDVVTL